ncbi:MAG: 23S rRNA (guanosine(2251)-2'-O)-methyltransferase RlmB [Pseudomonadota bacterium]
MSSTQLIGGWHVVLATLEDGATPPQEILIQAGREDDRAHRVRELARKLGVPIRVCSRGDLDLYAPELRHQGVLARVVAVAPAGEDVLDIAAPKDGLLLVLDGVQDPHNLGACIRSAEAAGAMAVIIPKDRAAELTAVARKASAGASERVPVLSVTNLSRTLEKLKEKGWWITGLAGEAKESIYQADLSAPRVLVLGAEGEGLRRLTGEHCDQLVKIPMHGKSESLNVSAAAAVCLFEAVRQKIAPRR